MNRNKIIALRPDISAAIRGGDTEQGMETEADPLTATVEQAMFWQRIYGETVETEEGVPQELWQERQSPEAI